MKASEIKIGGVYKAKVSGNIVDVKVDDINEKVTLSGKSRRTYSVTNLKTKRKLTFHSAAKFRSRVN